MTIAPGTSADLPIEATMLYQRPDGSRRVLAFEEFHDGFRFYFIGPRREQEQLNVDSTALQERMKRPHYLQYQVLKPDGSILERFEPRSWADIALDPELRDAVERNTIDIFRRRDAFRRNGVPLKRGIILHGPPGTGKTLIGKILAGLRIATFVYITAGDVDSPEAVRKTFELARKLAPAIVLMEDIDLYADKRSGHCSDAVLSEVLGQLDGFENNDGVIFIATTNDLAAVEPALSERPSRFDVVLHVGCPSEPARRAILTANLPADTADDRLLDEAAAATEGLSGAHVREVAFLALRNAILRDACDVAGLARPAAEDFAFAVERLVGDKKGGVGFGT